MIEWKFYNKYFPKSKATSCSTYSREPMQFWIHGLFYLNLLNTNIHICDPEISLETLNHQLCMILLQQLQIYQF